MKALAELINFKFLNFNFCFQNLFAKTKQKNIFFSKSNNFIYFMRTLDSQKNDETHNQKLNSYFSQDLTLQAKTTDKKPRQSTGNELKVKRY